MKPLFLSVLAVTFIGCICILQGFPAYINGLKEMYEEINLQNIDLWLTIKNGIVAICATFLAIAVAVDLIIIPRAFVKNWNHGL